MKNDSTATNQHNGIDPTDPSDDNEVKTGGRTDHYDFSILRNLRKSQGFTIADIAQVSGISTAVISRIERNQASPELDTIYRLGKAFGIAASDLLGLAESKHKQLVTAQHYVSGSFQFQHINFMNLQCFVGTSMGGGTVSRPEVHHNDIEICWALQGNVEIMLNDESHVLKEGDALQFDAVLKHTYRAISDCKLLIIHLRKGRAV